MTFIRDPAIRSIVESRLKSHGIEVGRGKKVDPKVWKQALLNAENPLTMPSGVPIKKVRVLRKEQTIQPIRTGGEDQAYVKPGSTHHLCIFEWEVNGETKRDAVFVTMLEAINRIKHRQPVIQWTHPRQPNARFVISLSRGECVLAPVDGREQLLVFNTGASTTQQMAFFLHGDARPRSQKRKITCYPSTFNGRKVTVDPLGRIRWAND